MKTPLYRLELNARKIDCPIKFFYPTSDDWHPNFPGNTVRISVYVYYTSTDPKHGMIRISVNGADDTLMEKDMHLPEAEYESELDKIREWIKIIPNPVSMKWLESQGFSFQ